MPETLARARHFLQGYLKLQKCCEQEVLILTSALMQASDHWHHQRPLAKPSGETKLSPSPSKLGLLHAREIRLVL